MFKEIEYFSQKWADAQLNLLLDTCLLTENINSELSIELKKFIEKLDSLDKNSKNAICRDHIFHKWLSELKTIILQAYSTNSILINNSERFAYILSMLNLTVSVAAGYESTFNWLPSFDSLVLLPGAGYYFNLNDAISKEAPCKCRYKPNLCSLEVEGSHKELKQFKQVKSISIVDKKFTFFSDPTGDEYDIKFDNNINLHQWSKTLQEALKIVETDKLSDQLIKNYVTFLIPLRQNKKERNLSFSVRNLPGVIFKNNEITPYLIGETLVHEADHQFFYAVERFNKFWKSDVRQQKPTYYSPWRDDPRPLDGVLRGLSAFTRVSKYYSSALESYPFTKEEHEVVGKLFLSRIEEAKAALEVISGEEQLSDFGTKYLIDIRDILSQSKASAEKHPQYNRWRNHALDNIEKHRQNWQKLNNIEF